MGMYKNYLKLILIIFFIFQLGETASQSKADDPNKKNSESEDKHDKKTETERIVGVWERNGDDFAGVRVKVYKSGEKYKALLLTIPDKMKAFCFAEGEVKWKNISKIDENFYKLEDLRKDCDSFPTYNDFHLEFYDDTNIVLKINVKESDQTLK